MAPMPHVRPRFLIVRFSSMGDVLLTTPVVRCLRQAHPEAEIHYLTKPAFATLLHGNPYIDRIITLGPSLAGTIGHLRATGYTGIIDLHHNLRTAMVKASMPWVPSYSFNKLNIAKWLVVNLRMDRLPRVHIVQRYLAAAAPFGVVDDGLGCDLFLCDDDAVPLPWPDGRPYVAMVIGGQQATKRMPTAKLIEVCRLCPLPVALVGGKEDAPVSGAIRAAVGEKVWDTCGQMTIRQSAHIIGKAAHVVAHDTGMMHVAAALKRPITSVWGNTVPAFGMYPYLPDGAVQSRIMEVQGLGCRPCSKLGHTHCPKGHFRCMMDQDAAAIVAGVPQSA